MKKYLDKFPFVNGLLKQEEERNFVFSIIKYEEIPTNTVIFNINDFGDLFFIILKGSVSV
jgi:hypothetical protein